MISIHYKDFKTLKVTGFGALAGRIQHMAAQKVWFTPRPIRYGSHNLHVQAQLHWNLHIRAELETCKFWEPYPRSMPIPDHFWPQITPSGVISATKHEGKVTAPDSRTDAMPYACSGSSTAAAWASTACCTKSGMRLRLAGSQQYRSPGSTLSTRDWRPKMHVSGNSAVMGSTRQSK